MMNYCKLLAITAYTFISLVVASDVKAQYIPEKKTIIAHKTVTVNLPKAEKLTIVYRPGSNISDTIKVPLKGKTYQWTPHEAGIVALKIPNGPKQTVSVRFEEAPLGGFFIMFGAAFILFGGAVYASTRLFGKESPDEIASRPDT